MILPSNKSSLTKWTVKDPLSEPKCAEKGRFETDFGTFMGEVTLFLALVPVLC